MSEPVYPGPNPNPSAQNPVQAPDLAERDPLLESGWFIDPDHKADTEIATQKNRETEKEKPKSAPAPAQTTTTSSPESAVPIYATPISQRRPRKPVEEMTERPNWLPEGWNSEVRVRTSGATAGLADRYYIAPSGQKFRSKLEVLRFLETGSKHKRKSTSDADAAVSANTNSPSENMSDNRKKKSKPNIRNFSDLNFDFKNPPQCLTWVQEDDCPDAWIPVAGNATVPESVKTEWGTVFSRITQLDKSNGAS